MKKEKIIICKQCENTYNNKIKRCPNCGTINKKLLFKRIRRLVSLLLIVALGFSGFVLLNKDDDKKIDVDINDNIQKIEDNDENQNTEIPDIDNIDPTTPEVPDDTKQNNEVTNDSIDDNFTIERNDNNKSSLDRSNSIAQEVNLPSGQYTVGNEIQIGRYVCTLAEGTGTITIYDENNEMLFCEIIGSDDNFQGVSSLTVDLKYDYVIDINSDNLSFIPVNTEKKDVLSAGNWITGMDIDEGTYVLSGNTTNGSIIINRSSGEQEILDLNSNNKVKLEDNDEILIFGIDEIAFSKV